MDFTFQVHSETIMSNPIPLLTKKTFVDGRVILGEFSNSKTTGRAGCKVYYKHTSDRESTLKIVSTQRQGLFTVKNGIEPSKSMWSRDVDGKPVHLDERPPFDPKEDGGWIMDLCMSGGHELRSFIKSVENTVARLAAKSHGVKFSNVKILSALDVFGESAAVISFRPGVGSYTIVRGSDGTGTDIMKDLSDYPIEDSESHFIDELVLTPSYTQFYKDEDDTFISRIFWRVFAFKVGDVREKKPELTEEEKKQKLIESFQASMIPLEDEEDNDTPTPTVVGKKRSAPAQEAGHRAAKKAK